MVIASSVSYTCVFNVSVCVVCVVCLSDGYIDVPNRKLEYQILECCAFRFYASTSISTGTAHSLLEMLSRITENVIESLFTGNKNVFLLL